MKEASVGQLVDIDGIGEVIAESFVHYFANAHNIEILEKLEKVLTLIPMEEGMQAAGFDGVNFVVTGSVEHFKNRKEVKERIEALGGKVTGSVTSKTNYLINNDSTSNSSKNKKAKELGIPIITEEQLIAMLEEVTK